MSEPRLIDAVGTSEDADVIQFLALLPAFSTPLEPRLMIVPQTQYQPRQHTGSLHTPIQFGFPLRDALHQDTTRLIHHDADAFSSTMQLPQKMSIVLQFCGHDQRYSRQVNILRAHSTPPTRGRLATIVAREVHRFLTRAAQAGKPFQFGGQYIAGLEDLILVDVLHVSKSTLQPTIAIRAQSLA